MPEPPPAAETIVQVHDDAPEAKTTEPVTLTWENVSYTIRTGKEPQSKTLLKNVSGFVAPGNVVAIMGASGAGKSTLLNVLAGRIGAGTLEGRILVNGAPRDPALWKQTVSYVEQDDLMFENLTVRETLQYAALLRLPSTMSNEAKRKRVDEIITELGLAKCENTIIGSPETRGISGGERKRVSIGIELVTDPKLLFLDEPTSGLDAFTASTIVETVKKIAVQGKRTVLMTIHQPREYILSLFDKLILLSAGKLVYFGDVQGASDQFAKCGFPCPNNTNPSDHWLDTMTIDFRSPELKEASLARVQVLQDSWNTAEMVMPEIVAKEDVQKRTSKYWPNSAWYELMVLLRRNFQDLSRDKATIGATLGQAVINMLILGFVFLQMDLSSAGIRNRIGSLFFIPIQLTFGNVMPTIAVFTLQRMIIKRERAAGSYRASSAYIAKLLAQLPLVAVATLVFALPVYWMMGLNPLMSRYLTFIVIVLVHALVATIMGIMISSGVPNVRVGQIIGPLLIVVFLIFGGQLVDTETAPAALSWIRWISIIFYTYTALAQNEMIGLEFQCYQPIPGCVRSGEDALRELNLIPEELPSLWYNELIVGGLGVAFVIIGYILFRWRSRPLMKLK